MRKIVYILMIVVMTILLTGAFLVFAAPESTDPELMAAQTDTAFDVVLVVNNANPRASDNNPGTEAFPFQTIDSAVETALRYRRNALSVQILVAPGDYRESIIFSDDQGGMESTAPLLIEAQDPGTVRVLGSEHFDSWLPFEEFYPGRTSIDPIWAHAWSNAWGVQENVFINDGININPLGRRREILLIDGQLIEQVLGYTDLREGTFFVSDENSAIFLWPPADIDMSTAHVEVGVRQGLLYADGVHNLTIRGMDFLYTANGIADNAAIYIIGANNVLFEDVNTEWNNWSGLFIENSENITLRRMRASHNGHAGIKGTRIINLVVEDTEMNGNNWRGHWAGFYDWDAGHKFFFLRDSRFTNLTIEDNWATGLWLDADNVNVVIEDSTICHNYPTAMFIEGNHDITVRNNIICGGTGYEESARTPGVLISVTRDMLLQGNVICGNDVAQIALSPVYEREMLNWVENEWYMLRAENLTMRDNIIVGNNADQLLFRSTNWDFFLGTVVSTRNLFYNPASEAAFEVAEAPLTYEVWTAMIGESTDSLFADPSTTNGWADRWEAAAAYCD